MHLTVSLQGGQHLYTLEELGVDRMSRCFEGSVAESLDLCFAVDLGRSLRNTLATMSGEARALALNAPDEELKTHRYVKTHVRRARRLMLGCSILKATSASWFDSAYTTEYIPHNRKSIYRTPFSAFQDIIADRASKEVVIPAPRGVQCDPLHTIDFFHERAAAAPDVVTTYTIDAAVTYALTVCGRSPVFAQKLRERLYFEGFHLGVELPVELTMVLHAIELGAATCPANYRVILGAGRLSVLGLEDATDAMRRLDLSSKSCLYIMPRSAVPLHNKYFASLLRIYKENAHDTRERQDTP